MESAGEAERHGLALEGAAKREWHAVAHPNLEDGTMTYSLHIPRPVQIEGLSLEDFELIVTAGTVAAT